jgi:hypothetical protein
MTNMKDNETSNGNTVLWATAFFIAALIFVAAGQHTSRAVANSTNTADGFTILTTSNGQGTDFLHVIDNATSMYMVYNIPDPQNKKSIETVATWFLPAMFDAARN